MAFDMSDYVDVKHRLQLALLEHPQLNIVEELPEIIIIGERVYIQCGVTVFRSPDDPLPCRAYCWEVFPGRTPFTKDSEQPNGATSALGRALGYMGFGIHAGIASANEVRTSQGNSHPATEPRRQETPYNNDQPSRPRGLATEAQLRLIKTMCDERLLVPGDMTGMTYAEAGDEIKRLKTVPRPKS